MSKILTTLIIAIVISSSASGSVSAQDCAKCVARPASKVLTVPARIVQNTIDAQPVRKIVSMPFNVAKRTVEKKPVRTFFRNVFRFRR